MTDPLLLGLAAATFGGVCLDTYFWVRTTVRLKEFDEEIQPRLGVIDAVAERIGGAIALEQPSGAPQAIQVSEVRRTKKGSPYVVLNGKARFLSERQAKALASGTPVATVLGLTGSPPLAVPDANPPPRPGGGGAPSYPSAPVGEGVFDYDGAAAHLSQMMGRVVTSDDVRTFEAAHVIQPGGGAAPPPSFAGTAPGGDPVMDLINALANGQMNSEAAGAAARQLIMAPSQTDRRAPGGWQP